MTAPESHGIPALLHPESMDTTDPCHMHSEILGNFAVTLHPCSIGCGNRIIPIRMITLTGRM